MPAPSSISWAATPAAASPRPPTSNQPCDCWKSTATCVGSTLNLPATHRAVADRPHRGSWSTLCHAPQKPQKPQNPRRSRFCGFCGFCGAWPESQLSGDRLAMTESGMAARALFLLAAGCHVIQREWLQPYPAKPTSTCRGFWPPGAFHGPQVSRCHGLVWTPRMGALGPGRVLDSRQARSRGVAAETLVGEDDGVGRHPQARQRSHRPRHLPGVVAAG